MNRTIHLRRLGGLLAALTMATMASADSGRGRHRQLYAVPTPGAVTIDGRLDDWDLSGQIEMFVVEPTRDTMNAKFALAYDDQALYLAGEVRDPSPMMNRNDPAANPGRQTPAPGDVRLLVTRQDKKPVAILYQPKIADFAGEPIVLTSPTGQESFDRITVLDSIGLTDENTATGFLATVAIPQSAIGLKLAPGQTIKLDLGYVFGNREGSRTAVRAYLFNRSFAANVVDDIPHETRLEPAQWGQATVE